MCISINTIATTTTTTTTTSTTSTTTTANVNNTITSTSPPFQSIQANHASTVHGERTGHGTGCIHVLCTLWIYID